MSALGLKQYIGRILYIFMPPHMILPCFIGSLSRDEVSNSCTVVLLSLSYFSTKSRASHMQSHF